MLKEKHRPSHSALRIGILIIVSILSACTRSASPQLPRPDASQKPDQGVPGLGEEGAAQGAQSNGIVKTSISARDIQNAYIDLKDLKYRFSYVDVVREGDLVFTNGSASISIADLPTGRDGVLTLDVSQRGQKVLSGSLNNVRLQGGSQTLNLVLRPVNQPATSNVIINATIDMGTQPPVLPTPTPTPPTVGPPPPGGTDLMWDGKSFLGNDQWDLIPIN